MGVAQGGACRAWEGPRWSDSPLTDFAAARIPSTPAGPALLLEASRRRVGARRGLSSHSPQVGSHMFKQGINLTQISLPVCLFEPRSFLERLTTNWWVRPWRRKPHAEPRGCGRTKGRTTHDSAAKTTHMATLAALPSEQGVQLATCSGGGLHRPGGPAQIRHQLCRVRPVATSEVARQRSPRPSAESSPRANSRVHAAAASSASEGPHDGHKAFTLGRSGGSRLSSLHINTNHNKPAPTARCPSTNPSTPSSARRTRRVAGSCGQPFRLVRVPARRAAEPQPGGRAALAHHPRSTLSQPLTQPAHAQQRAPLAQPPHDARPARHSGRLAWAAGHLCALD
jgi:hypothetical protein